MRRSAIFSALAGALVATGIYHLVETASMADDTKAEPALVHNVYFTLKDGTPENIRRLTESCHKYLTNHDGCVYFGAGGLVDELQRPVNQRDFHVGLCVIFKNKAAHDAYQIHPRHLQFIAENKETWAQVRVFDSWGK